MSKTRNKRLRKKSTRRRNRGGEDKKKSRRRRRTPAPHKPAPKTLKSPPKPHVPSPSASPLQEFPAFKKVNPISLARSIVSKLSDEDKKLLSKRNEELAKSKIHLVESKSTKATRDIKQMLGMK